MIIKKVIEDLGHGMLLLEDNRLYIVAGMRFMIK
jgi:hypothetical protein